MKCEYGAVEGDIAWKNEGEFTFLPPAGWISGMRYRFSLSGSVRAKDGREARPLKDIAFYALRSGGAPSLLSAYPKDGATVGTSSTGGGRLVLTFSEPMAGKATEDALSFSPAIDCVYSWNGTKTTLTAEPKTNLVPCAVYRWTLTRDAAAADGARLSREERGAFAADADGQPPAVVRTYPALSSGSTWVDAGGTLADLDAEEAVVVEFSEAMDETSARGSISFSPSLAGRTEVLDSRRVVFILDRNPESGKALTLIVSPDVKDAALLPMGSEYRESFTPAIPHLRILRFEALAGEALLDPSTGQVLPVTVSVPDGIISASIRFSVSIPLSSRVEALSKIRLSAFFPGTLSAPTLRSLSWPSSDTAVLIWEDLERSPSDYANYYALTISGGSGGILGEKGLALQDDVSFFLEAKR